MATGSTVTVRITLTTFIRIFGVVFGLLLLWLLRDILLLLFLAMILAAAISPWINGLARHGLPRPLGLVIVYVGLIGILVAVILLLIPAISRESSSLAKQFPGTYERIVEFVSRGNTSSEVLTAAKDNLSALTRGVFAGLRGVAGGFASFFLVLVLTFYFTIGEENLRRFWMRLAPVRFHDRLRRMATAAEERIGNWFRYQLVVSLLIATVSYFVLTLVGIPDALLLSIIAGVASFVPFIGAIIGVIPAVVVALTLSTAKATIVLVITLALYQVIGNVLVPKLMSRAVGLNPIIIIVVMLLGAEIAGALGLILAVPVTSIIDTVIREGVSRRDQQTGESDG